MIVYNNFMRRLYISIAALLGGVLIHYVALWFVDQRVTLFPRVVDLLIDRWPRYNFGWYGEAFFFLFLAVFLVMFFTRQWRQAPRLFLAIGLL